MAVPFDQRDGVIWYDGQLVPWADAKLHVLSHGLHYGSCVFEGERAYGGRIFKSTEHSERLKNSARILDFEIPYSVAEIDAAKKLVLEKNGSEGCLCASGRLARLGNDGRLRAEQQDPSRHRDRGNGRAISIRSSGLRASGSISPNTAAPIRGPRPASPRPRAST